MAGKLTVASKSGEAVFVECALGQELMSADVRIKKNTRVVEIAIPAREVVEYIRDRWPLQHALTVMEVDEGVALQEAPDWKEARASRSDRAASGGKGRGRQLPRQQGMDQPIGAMGGAALGTRGRRGLRTWHGMALCSCSRVHSALHAQHA